MSHRTLIFIALLFLLICTLVFSFTTGCATLDLQQQATTRPVTPLERVSAAQTDFETLKGGFNLSHSLGLISETQWVKILAAEQRANDSLAIVRELVTPSPTNPNPAYTQEDFNRLMNEAAKAIDEYKHSNSSNRG